MKKMFLFGALFAVGLSFTACSSDNDESGNDVSNRLTENGEGYISVGISLPTDPASSTRANDDFVDGTTDEYEVTDAYLLLFTGADEDASTFAGIYSLNANPLNNNASAQISKEAQVTTKINGSLLTGTNVYAYVILNQNGVIDGYSDDTPGSFTFKAADGDKTMSKTISFSTFKAYELAASTIHNGSNKHFLMTNAVVSSKRGGDADPTGADITTLAKLDKDKIYSTKSEAEANPAGHIDVERAAVKVTVGCEATALKGKDAVTFSFFGWALGNTNSTYYNTRKWTKTGGAWNWLGLASPTTDNDEGTPLAATLYRFVSKAYLDNGTTYDATKIDKDRARTYWCEDPNYTGKSGLENTTIAAGSYTNAKDASAYTTENTFNVSNMTFENTTYVAVNLTFNGGADFYTASTYGESEILQKSQDDGYTGSATSVKDYILDTYLASDATLKSYLTTNGKDAIELTMANNTTTGVATIASFEVKSTSPAYSGTLPSASDLNSAIHFKYFKDGQSYYGVRIKHFGAGGSVATADAATGKESGCETPWNNKIHSANTVAGVYQEKVVSGTTTSYSSADQDKYFLGRYGVVRNNWYNLNIQSVRKIGSPIPVTPDGTPDDEIENYLSVKIHILSWAKRSTQSVDL